MYDTHCHLFHERFDADREEVIERAHQAGVTGFVVPAVDRPSWSRISALHQSQEAVVPAFGIHPVALKDGPPSPDDWTELEQRLQDASAVGECGLDKRWAKDRKGRELQSEVLVTQLELACTLDLPVILHCVRDHGALLELLRAHPVRAGVLHAYSGSAEMIVDYARLGLYFGFGLAVGRPNAVRAVEAVKQVHEDKLLIETDAPDQAEGRDERNEPAAVARVAELVAGLRGTEAAAIAERSDHNLARMLSWTT